MTTYSYDTSGDKDPGRVWGWSPAARVRRGFLRIIEFLSYSEVKIVLLNMTYVSFQDWHLHICLFLDTKQKDTRYLTIFSPYFTHPDIWIDIAFTHNLLGNFLPACEFAPSLS